ncbi:DMT family transporter [Desulfosporosinus lacus]|uniref:Permease of the drug/metabolite transporter (DMT) superfamily n=1 Tax=Desulfosporosinus lacus DSM 15449 TaxID=1121420 RepID=A0A1M5Y4D3_9FIRM|nr:DMT family transporter [Desulfosporosinus lacus]SHI06658.1 Permease of the drug/metabolite transporter (DMT) superfamily [Desulfosporosinus lacus DSM 15449]
MRTNYLSNKRLGLFYAMFSGIFWGTNGTFCTLLSDLGLGAQSIAILAPAYNLIFFSTMLLITNKPGFKIKPKLLVFILLGGMTSAISNTSFVKSVSYFPVGIVSTLIFCNVFVIMIISRIVFKHRITTRKIGAAIITVFGVCLVLDVFSQGFHLNYYGLFWILMTILSWSIMMTLEKYLLEEGVDENAVLMYIALFAVIILSFSTSPVTVVSSIVQISSKTHGYALLVILGFGLIPQIGCYSFYIKGLKYIEPSYMQIFYSLDPVMASILGYFVFNQTLNFSNMAGMCIILGVVIYIQIAENREGIESTTKVAKV